MRVLFVPYGTEKAPATRYRVIQYLPHLKKRGIDYFVFSAISKFSTSLMIKSPDFVPFAKYLYYLYVLMERLFRFFCILILSRMFDVVFLQRTTFPFKLEILLKIANCNIIFDIDDAIYLPDKQDNDIATRIKKYIKEREVIGILKVAKAVVVENEYIKDFVSRYCKNIYKTPGPIDTERFFVRHKPKRSHVVIGWIGTPATTPYLYRLNDVFKNIKRRYDFVKFKFIGPGRYRKPDITFERINWDYETEVKNLQDFDIGVMPMPDNEWTRGKLGCKMLQYMALGIAPVASYTPTNAEIIQNGENGFFATTDTEWTKTLSALIEDEKLRKRIGQKARETIVEKCSLVDNINGLIDIFSKLNKR